MNERIVLIGAGSAVFTRGLVADMIRRKWSAELVLVDVDPLALEVAEKLARKMIAASHSTLHLYATTDRRTALRNATAVICTIGVGGRRAWEKDVFIPRQFGIFQPVGDSVMPGGTSRALRMIPAMVDIAKDVLDLCPHALFFNYGNPMAAVCRAVHKATGANIVGLCHGVFHVADYLARTLNVAPARTSYAAVGINHLTWFVEFRVDGQDAMPQLHQIADAKLKNGPNIGSLGANHARPAAPGSPPNEQPFSWQLLQLFGGFPSAMDRHVVEFFPQFFRDGAYFGNPSRKLGVDAFSFENTIAQGDKTYADMQQLAHSPEPLPADYLKQFSGEHEQVTDIIDAVRSNRPFVISATLPNRGQVPNLPPDAPVESPAIADAAGVRPIQQPPLSPAIVGTLATRFAWVETTVEAALEASREKFVQALLLDGAVSSLAQARHLADALLTAHADHLPRPFTP